jgi:hypothetical protein
VVKPGWRYHCSHDDQQHRLAPALCGLSRGTNAFVIREANAMSEHVAWQTHTLASNVPNQGIEARAVVAFAQAFSLWQ